ncbi:hypothetical protein [Rhodococcus phenolicus]|uniref:hypothetical protein n=1 Tax=Rhodococcus phenolicus TaxID=263849 RepID=UPI000AC70D66|nr:hypothetical protein [Rhodococcus phenolicus]
MTGPLLPAPETAGTVLRFMAGARLAVLADNRQMLEGIAVQANEFGVLPDLLAAMAWEPIAMRVLQELGRHIADGATHEQAWTAVLEHFSGAVFDQVEAQGAEFSRSLAALLPAVLLPDTAAPVSAAGEQR